MASDIIDTSTGINNCTREASSSAQNKRKEKARIAARARRSQEANIIMDMANELHISQEKMRRIDKATIVKLAIDYIKAFEILCKCKPVAPLATPYEHQILKSCPVPIPTIIQTNQQDHKTQLTHNTKHTTSAPALDTIPTVIDTPPTTIINNSMSASMINESKIFTSNIFINNHNTVNDTTNNTDNNYLDNSAIQQATTTTLSTNNQSNQNSQPKLSTISIFAPKTEDVDSHFLLLETRNGCSSLVLKSDTEIDDSDDLTHLAPQAGDISISLDVEPLDGIVIDSSLFSVKSQEQQSYGSPPMKEQFSPISQHVWSTV